ncbi:MAG: PilZ domain-containing protein [Hyphomicrobiaceae bacterium]
MPRETPRLVADRRRHKRVNVTLLGRFMRSNKQEYPCKLVDISVGGAAMISPVTVDDDERIVAYFDNIGGIEGKVARLFEGGFAIRLSVTPHKREKLAAQLTWLINRSAHLVDDRVHKRSLPRNEQSSLQLDEGIVISCRVTDISISGASLETQARPEIGREVTLGKLRARVTRHHASGIGVQFLDIQNPAALRRYFG